MSIEAKEQAPDDMRAVRVAVNSRDAAEHEWAQDLLRAQHDLALALSGASGLDEGLRFCYEAASRVSGMDCGGIYLVDETSGALDLAFHQGLPPDFVESAGHYEADSASAQLVMAGTPIYTEHLRLGVPLDEARQRESLRAVAVVPVRHENRVIGCLNVASHTLNEVPVPARDALETIAAQVGDAIARLRVEGKLRQRTAQLDALRAMGLELAAELNLADLLNSIVSRAIALAGGTSGGLYLYRPEQDVIEWAVSVGPNMVPVGTVLHRGEGLSGKVWESGEALVVDDYQHWAGRAAIYEGYPYTSTMAIPVRWGDEFLGVLDVLGDAPGALSPADTELLKLFATQAAIALHNARLFEAERVARERAEKLQAATQALSATLNLQRIFELILSELRQVVPYDSASVQQVKEGRLEIIGGHGFPNLEELLGAGFDLLADDNPNREVVRTRAPLILDDVPAAYAAFRREPHAQAGIRSWLGVPLLFGERLIGMITLDKQVPGFYTQEHARLATAFAAQAATAIENARLYEEAQQRLRELTLLFETSAALSASLDTDTVLHTMARQITSTLAAGGCAISFLEPEQDAVVTLLEYSLDPDTWQPTPPGTIYRLADYPATRQVLAERRPLTVLVSDLRADPAEVAWMAAEGVHALLMVPLVVGDRVIGLLELMEAGRERAFAPTEIALCQTLANQGAAVLENARLYDDARRRNRELALLNRVIAASAASQDVPQILETVCTELALTFGVPQAAATLLDEGKTEAVVVAEYLAEGRPTAMGAVIPAVGNPASQYLLEHKTPLVIEDAQTDPRQALIRDLMHQRGTMSLLLLPLVVEGEVVGTLGLDTVEPRHFSSAEIDLAQRVAQQVSGALGRARLVEAQRRLTTAVEQTAEGIVVTATDGTVLYVNPALERITGYSGAEFLGQTLQILHSGKHDSAFYEQMQRTIAAGLVWQGRHTGQRKDGSLYTEEMTITPVCNQSGEIGNYVATMRDVTHEVELEDQFRQAQKMEAVGRLAGGVAHDFNNLMTVIHLSCRLLERKLRPEDALWPHVQRIRETGERATALTKQLLAFSRQEVMEPKVVNLNEAVLEMNEMLGRIIGEDIELITCLAQEPWVVYADPTQIEQVILNLAVNARDAMPSGGILTLSTANVFLDEAYTRQHLEVEPGEYVMLTVSDTGVGMDESVRQHLFEPFFTTKERGKGTGLGLATVFGIVKQHGGHIQVDSRMDQGTTFRIYLPRTERTESREKPSPAGDHPPLPGSPSQATETVLVVEDEANVRALIVDILRTQGYQVLAAASGPEALHLSQEHDGPLHLLLSDLVMPRMNGKELAEQMSAQRPEMQVLYMSGYADSTILGGSAPATQRAFLSKPFTAEHLIQEVQAVLGR
jgi:PAS domain S-box-containing protein